MGIARMRLASLNRRSRSVPEIRLQKWNWQAAIPLKSLNPQPVGTPLNRSRIHFSGDSMFLREPQELPQNEAASRKAHSTEEQPGTPRNRTGDFRLQLVRGGSIFKSSYKI